MSTWGMFVRVTGGISLAEGSFCAPEVEGYGRRPVRVIGGWSKVAMASDDYNQYVPNSKTAQKCHDLRTIVADLCYCISTLCRRVQDTAD